MQHPPDTHQYFWLRKILWRARNTGITRMVQLARRRVIRPAWFTGLLLSLVGCILPNTGAPPTATPPPTPTLVPTNGSDTWEMLLPGLERRIYRPSEGFLTRLTALRIDPVQFSFRVHYRPSDPQFADAWRLDLPEAVIIFNTNFFDRNDIITGMMFVDGVQYGQPYQQRGGTFYVNDTVAGIQSNLTQPYAGEQYQQAVQAFPMLVTDGVQSYFDSRADRTSRRTVVAIDDQGRVIVMTTTFGGITLLDLSQYLVNTDMNIVHALNLDGGGSTMLDIKAGETTASFPSFDPIPAVMAVYPR